MKAFFYDPGPADGARIEGKRNEPLMQAFESFCVRTGLAWGGVLCGWPAKKE